MKNKKTYYLLILDKSGSMQSVLSQTVEGFNEQARMIKHLQARYPKQEIMVSLTTFNDEIEHNMHVNKASEIKELVACEHNSFRKSDPGSKNKINYIPDGMTALYDAIGMSVNKLKNEISKEIKSNKATAVVVIITDGHENSSREYSFEAIRQLIDKLEKTEKWTFSYLGATPDAVSIATNLNIKKHNSFAFDALEMKDEFSMVGNQMSYYISMKEKGEIPQQLFDPED